MPPKFTKEYFQDKLDRLGGTIDVLECGNYRAKAKCKCRICGNIWYDTPTALYRWLSCPKCVDRYPNRWKHDDFVEHLKKINPNVKVLGTLVHTHEKIETQCLLCGKIWKAIPMDLLSGKGCFECKCKKAGVEKRKDHTQFVEEIRHVNSNIKVLGTYRTSKDPIDVECLVCGHKWSPVASSLIAGYGCPKCQRTHLSEIFRKPREQFVAEAKLANPGIDIIGEYKNGKDRILVECVLCHYQWKVIAQNILMQPEGCPCCSGSTGERAITAFLKAHDIAFIPQKTFAGLVGVRGSLLSYDFYLPNDNMLVEYQGQFHDGTASYQTEEEFERQKEHDRRKREYAIQHGYKFLEIWYQDFNNISSILTDALNIEERAS